MKIIYNPHTRIIATHILVIVILLINILFFTENTVSILLQVILIFAVIIHDKDDRLIKRKLEEKDSKLREDANIFDYSMKCFATLYSLPKIFKKFFWGIWIS